MLLGRSFPCKSVRGKYNRGSTLSYVTSLMWCHQAVNECYRLRCQCREEQETLGHSPIGRKAEELIVGAVQHLHRLRVLYCTYL